MNLKPKQPQAGKAGAGGCTLVGGDMARPGLQEHSVSYSDGEADGNFHPECTSHPHFTSLLFS